MERYDVGSKWSRSRSPITRGGLINACLSCKPTPSLQHHNLHDIYSSRPLTVFSVPSLRSYSLRFATYATYNQSAMSVKASKTAGLPSENPSKSFWHVEPSALLLGHRSTRNLPQEADVVVVGSGITGASVAWHLLQQNGVKSVESNDGLKVVMLEAREACYGATGRLVHSSSSLPYKS